MAQINWTKQANDDLDQLIDFWANQSDNYARIQVQRIIDKIDLITDMPKLGRVVPELEYEKVRELIIGTYRIVYHIVSQNRIDIITIHHSARPLDIKNL